MELIEEYRFKNVVHGYMLGLPAQLDQMQEEAGELIQAINKFKRSLGKGLPCRDKKEKILENLKEEIVDVYIMYEQLISLLQVPDEEFNQIYINKIKRTEEALNQNGK